MPLRDAVARRAYQQGWVATRRREFFADKACIECGSTEQLELDHLDPSQKVSHRIWSWSTPLRDAEIAKCVIRCHDCHVARHAAERRIEHSTGGYKRGCRCEVCCDAKRSANERYAARRGRNSNPGTRLCRPLPNRSATAPRAVANPTKEIVMERMLMAVRNDYESEPVVVESNLDTLVLRLDDGERLEFDRRELIAALELAA